MFDKKGGTRGEDMILVNIVLKYGQCSNKHCHRFLMLLDTVFYWSKIYHKLFSNKSWLRSWKPAREIFLYVWYLFSSVLGNHEGTWGEHEEKMCEVNFYRGRKKWGNIQKKGQCFTKGGPLPVPFPSDGSSMPIRWYTVYSICI